MIPFKFPVRYLTIRDFRMVPAFAIDSKSTRVVDDAISIDLDPPLSHDPESFQDRMQKLPNPILKWGRNDSASKSPLVLENTSESPTIFPASPDYSQDDGLPRRVYIHIARLDQYIAPFSQDFEQAVKQGGSSQYFIDKPPKHIFDDSLLESSSLSSIRENQVLTFSALIGKKGEILSSEIFPSIIGPVEQISFSEFDRHFTHNSDTNSEIPFDIALSDSCDRLIDTTLDSFSFEKISQDELNPIPEKHFNSLLLFKHIANRRRFYRFQTHQAQLFHISRNHLGVSAAKLNNEYNSPLDSEQRAHSLTLHPKNDHFHGDTDLQPFFPNHTFLIENNSKAVIIGTTTQSLAKDIIQEFMLIAGETASIFGQKNGIPLRYTTSPYMKANIRDFLKTLDTCFDHDIDSFSTDAHSFKSLSNYDSKKLNWLYSLPNPTFTSVFRSTLVQMGHRRSQVTRFLIPPVVNPSSSKSTTSSSSINSEEGGHFSQGLQGGFVSVTSPLRKVGDFISNLQILSFLNESNLTTLVWPIIKLDFESYFHSKKSRAEKMKSLNDTMDLYNMDALFSHRRNVENKHFDDSVKEYNSFGMQIPTEQQIKHIPGFSGPKDISGVVDRVFAKNVPQPKSNREATDVALLDQMISDTHTPFDVDIHKNERNLAIAQIFQKIDHFNHAKKSSSREYFFYASIAQLCLKLSGLARYDPSYFVEYPETEPDFGLLLRNALPSYVHDPKTIPSNSKYEYPFPVDTHFPEIPPNNDPEFSGYWPAFRGIISRIFYNSVEESPRGTLPPWGPLRMAQDTESELSPLSVHDENQILQDHLGSISPNDLKHPEQLYDKIQLALDSVRYLSDVSKSLMNKSNANSEDSEDDGLLLEIPRETRPRLGARVFLPQFGHTIKCDLAPTTLEYDSSPQRFYTVGASVWLTPGSFTIRAPHDYQFDFYAFPPPNHQSADWSNPFDSLYIPSDYSSLLQ